MPDPRSRFTATAEAYERWRPDYPSALYDWLALEASLGPGAAVVDVGCGTGIAARQMAARGWAVTGVDPNPAMLEKARAAGGPIDYRAGEAAATALPGAAFALVSAAQAFHWFDPDAALAEFARLLRPGGHAAVFWNARAPTPFLEAYEGLLRRASGDYLAIPRPREVRAALAAHPRVRAPREASFPHAQVLDHEGFLGRVRSTSYVAHGVADRAAFAAALEDLYTAHQQDHRVVFAYDTIALVFRIT